MCYVFICIRGGPLEIGGGGGVAISEKKIMQGQFTWKKKSCRTPWWEKIPCKLNAHRLQKRAIEINIR